MRLLGGLPSTLVVRVGTDSYMIRHQVEATLPTWYSGLAVETILPAVVLNGHDNVLTLQDVKESFARFLEKDDVFQEGFMHDGLLIVQTSSLGGVKGDETKQQQQIPEAGDAKEHVTTELGEYLRERALTLVLTTRLSVPEGPYFVLGGQLHEAWKLYADHLGAFTTGIVPDDNTQENGHFTSIQNTAFTGADTSVAVPSRLYFKATPDKPLNGLRVAVKDNVNVAGVVTGLGSKSYAELYGKQGESAEIVKRLVSQGAIIVGKNKLSAFAGSEVPPCECIDYFPPWNPRGDGYQGPSGSSSGPGACAAGYDWLDLAIGTDTTGSIRYPATSHGVWAHKVSWGTVPMEGVVPACEPFDSIGLMGRTTRIMRQTLVASGFTDNLSKPNKIVLPTEWLPVSNAPQQLMIDLFVEALEAYLGVKHTKMSLTEEWSRSRPEKLQDKSIFEVEDMGLYVNGYDNYHNFDAFRAQYEDKFQKPPYVSPSHLDRWSYSLNRTEEARMEAVENLKLFKKWAMEALLTNGQGGSARSIMIVPHGRPGANYRDTEPPQDPSSLPTEKTTPPPPKLDAVYITSMLGVPQLLIPIGQNPYESKISKRTEFAPIFVSIVGAPGTDVNLLRIGQEVLEQAGWPTEVKTGRFMFEVGDNERHSSGPQGSHKL